ncbi:YgiQ family radical SAM protein [Luminiphilus sp. nBUS_07]|uniref:YgiQ family radical SAM protein n=1 Tax=Luminiphilus sp. nBUS_07 TaxID=3395314 RepID=UPI003EBBF652
MTLDQTKKGSAVSGKQDASITPIFEYRKFWAECLGPAPFLPTSREEMDALGWDSCDVIVVTGDAYVDHPSFGMAVIGRVLEGQGYRVGIISQPNWHSAEPFKALGKPNLFMGVAAGNMDSMINHYTADRKRRNDDAYTPGDHAGMRPDRAVTVYSQRVREAFNDVPIVIGGIEASLRRIAHYDYWSEKVRRSVLLDSKADILLFGNAERAIVELTHRLASGESISALRSIRGTAFITRGIEPGFQEVRSTDVDNPGPIDTHPNPYEGMEPSQCDTDETSDDSVQPLRIMPAKNPAHSVIRIPSYEQVRDDPVLYAHASRVLHKETNPFNALPLIQAHGDRDVWINPPPIPLETEELDWVFELPYARHAHPQYGEAKVPAFEMIQHSVNIMRGCFGGCTFCSITEHEGRIIQNRSEDSIIREVERIRDTSPAFTGVISDLGGPTANMWRLACKSKEIEAKCRKLSCVFPGICKNLNTDQTPLISLYRRARAVPGIKKVLIASGLRYDIAVETPEYVKELVTHHVGGYLKIAPEHTEDGPLSHMMKPGIGTYERFKTLFDKYSKEAGKKQYLIPYFIAAHPGTRDEDMMNLALWLKHNKFRADQVQTFYPSPMATATAMYHTRHNPLKRIRRTNNTLPVVDKLKQRRLHKAFLRYHDPENWPLLRDELKRMGRRDLIGNGKLHLVPSRDPPKRHRVVKEKARPFATQHTGLPGRSGKRKK